MGRRRRLASGISCGRISELRVFRSRNFYRENLLDFKFTPSEGRFQGLKIFFYLYEANRTDTHHGLKNAVDKSDICILVGLGQLAKRYKNLISYRATLPIASAV